MLETGADGIRLDEYGHRGWACYDESHEHTYAEAGDHAMAEGDVRGDADGSRGRWTKFAPTWC